MKKTCLIAGLAIAVLIPSSAGATPTAVTLHLDGFHAVDVDYHQGTFTAPSPLCSSGRWQGNGQNARVFTCADGSGTFTASFNGELEHTAGSTGPWAITAGTGSYTALRGKGTGKVDSSTGPTPPVYFSDTWTGVVDFDATAPTGSVTLKVTRLRGHRWRVRATLLASDNVEGNAVSYRATASAGSYFASRSGTVSTGRRSLAFVFRARRGRRFEIELTLADPCGNTSTIRRAVRLR
ncbi:MAG TPA: hypothetical protein VK488_15130 [Gaiellaceae bacterium]|nr:hypothetical protein [Gaiellaceae bacterium]